MKLTPTLCLLLLLITGSNHACRAAEIPANLQTKNLAAWCIVPFDSKPRTPEERAIMLKELGVTRCAYDWRDQHVAEFEEEILQYKKHGIEFFAFWSEHPKAFELFRKHDIHPQIWRMMSQPKGDSQEAMVAAAAASMDALAKRTAAIGCKLGLYNHGGWSGEPKNMVAVCKRLREQGHKNVGIVYNWHHGHGHIEDWADSLALMKPYLLCLNLNGMNTGAQPKILPIGLGQHELAMLKTVAESGYEGPIGILNHTQLDAKLRLHDNIDGLDWLLKQLDGSEPGPKPKYRTWSDSPGKPQASNSPGQFPGKVYDGNADYRQPPITVECQATVYQKRSFNILVASDTKQSGDHWEVFTFAGNGKLTAYLPGRTPDHVRSDVDICDGRPHKIAFTLEKDRGRLFLDGRLVADQKLESLNRPAVPGGLAIGRLVEGGLGCDGHIDRVRISKGVRNINSDSAAKIEKDEQTLNLWMFEKPASKTSQFQSPEYSAELVASLAHDAAEDGVAERGIPLFAAAKSACLQCHKVGHHGGSVGPDLSKIGVQRTPAQIVESLLWPKREVKPEFTVIAAVTSEGKVHKGYREKSEADVLVLRDPASEKTVRIPTDEVEQEVVHGTLMPDGLTAAMSRQQQLDLIQFLITLGRKDGPELDVVSSVLAHAHSHAPAEFEYVRDPLAPGDWPNWQHHINRDRVYDFYTKQANHFRGKSRMPMLLSEFPGLDNGKFGHWGNQDESTWAGNEWNEADLGTLQCGVFRTGTTTVARAVCVRLGDHGELSVCFNPDTWRYEALWSGGFLKTSSVRHGFVSSFSPDGKALPVPEARDVPGPFRYLGYYRHGKRVVFAFDVAGTTYLEAPWIEDGHFVTTVAPPETHPLRHLLKPGEAQWPQKLQTEIEYGHGRPYAVDTIQIPIANPWNVPVFGGGLAMLADGSALFCTMHGDVWHVTGLQKNSPTATWRRFASGLHHALGIVADDDGIFVLGRNQITRLHDSDNNGEADYYECFSNAYKTSAAGHDFICGLQRDADGRFYTASGNQGLVRISADGQRADVIATGFRNPDGLGLHPNGFLTVPCSEGGWTPSSMICEVPMSHDKEQAVPFYGYGGPRGSRSPELPLIYLPRGLDNSSGGQVHIDSDRWGPLNGNMVHLSFGTGSHFLLLRDVVDGQSQGAVVPLRGDFLSGVHRGRFSPVDGQLYVSGMAGWGSYTRDAGCFHRVRYTGDPVQLPVGFHVYENGVSITLSEPVDAEIANKVGSHFAQCWNYRYSGAYGSPEYSTRHQGIRGHDVLQIRTAHVLDEGRTLFLELPDIQPVNQLHLRLNVGNDEAVDLFATVHRLDRPFTDFDGYVPSNKTIAPHPIEGDLLLATRRVPNPWRKEIKDARPVRLETGKNLTFANRRLRVRAGEALKFTLANPDVVPHNWVLAKPGTLKSVGEASNRLVADPEAFARHYVPQSENVLVYTDIVGPRSDFTIHFRAPQQPGVYPYLCTFPGHWMVMNGELVVE